jgi:hypothetical protein
MLFIIGCSPIPRTTLYLRLGSRALGAKVTVTTRKRPGSRNAGRAAALASRHIEKLLGEIRVN